MGGCASIRCVSTSVRSSMLFKLPAFTIQPNIDASTYWWIENASAVSATISSFIFGFWLNLLSTAVLMAMVNILAAVTTLIFILLPVTPATIIWSQVVYGIWSGVQHFLKCGLPIQIGAILVGSLAYFARAIAVGSRTTWVLGVYFTVNTFGPGVIGGNRNLIVDGYSQA